MNSIQARSNVTTLEATYASLLELLEVIVDRNEQTALFDVAISLMRGSYQSEHVNTGYRISNRGYEEVMRGCKRFLTDVEEIRALTPLNYRIDINVSVPATPVSEDEELPHPEDNG